MSQKSKTPLWIFTFVFVLAGVLMLGVSSANAIIGVDANFAVPRPTRGTPLPRATPTPIAGTTPTATPLPGGGGTFQVVNSPNVGNLNNRLNGVSAISANDIWAVGETYTINGSGRQTLIQHWDGNSWQIVNSPNADSTSNRLLGVAAVSATDAWAVGLYGGVTGPNWQPLIVRYNGADWTLVPAPSTGSGAAQLNAITARAANDVWAVGSFTNASTNWWDQPLIMRWDGATWSIIPSPQIGTSSVLNGVTAIAPDNVWAVGYTLSNNYTALILHWDGFSWTQVASNAGTSTRLLAVAAISSTDIWAVGSQNTGTATLTLHWNGTAWSVVSSPNGNYSGTNQHSLVGLAATSSNDVWAVGSSAYSGLCGGSDAPDYRTYTLVLHWNGANWQQAGTVNPGPLGGCNTPRNDFYGVTAINGQAIAVGAYYDPTLSVQFFRTLIEQGQ